MICAAENQERFKDYGARQPPHQSSLNGALAPHTYGNCSRPSPRQLRAGPPARFHDHTRSSIKRQVLGSWRLLPGRSEQPTNTDEPAANLNAAD
jgi:hypothetical protein